MADELIVQGKTVADVCRVLDVSQPISHRRRQLYVGMKVEEAKRLTQLVNVKYLVEKLLAEAEQDNAMLQDLAERYL